MKIKKIMCAALAAAAAVTVAPAVMAAGTGFGDVNESHWAYAHINSMAERGIIEGYDDGSFLPEKTVTRAEFAKMLAGAAALSPQSADFGDVAEDAWYASYVRSASAYLVPVDGMFVPDGEAKRKDIAAAIVRVKCYDAGSADTAAAQARFSDLDALSEDEKGYIASAVENGIMDGFDGGVFKPEEGITRAQAAAILDRAFGNDELTAIKVNNISVNINDLERLAAISVDGFYDMSEEQRGYVKQMAAMQIENALICGEAAKALGLEPTEEYVRETESYKQEAISYENAPSKAFVDTLFNAVAYQNTLMDTYVDELSNAEDIDKDIEEYYKNNFFCAKHILVEDEATAKELLKKVQDGEDFDELMKKDSTDPGMEQFPNGYVFTYDDMVPEFEECVINTEIGGFGLCKSDYGWHVILRLELPEDYSGVQSDIERAMINSHIKKRMSEDALKCGVTSEINWELINAVG